MEKAPTKPRTFLTIAIDDDIRVTREVPYEVWHYVMQRSIDYAYGSFLANLMDFIVEDMSDNFLNKAWTSFANQLVLEHLVQERKRMVE